MPRIDLSEAERDFANLVECVHSEGISIDLARGNEVIARLMPARSRTLKIHELNQFLQSLPRLGDEAERF